MNLPLPIDRTPEYPITRFWYGKGAQYDSIEELIEKDKDYFLWCVKAFQDVTMEQAEHYFKWWGEYLPDEVIAPEGTVPYSHTKQDQGVFYGKLCEMYGQKKRNLL